MQAPKIQYFDSHAWPNWPTVSLLLEQAGLGRRDPEAFQRAAGNDRATVFAVAGARLVGFGRLMAHEGGGNVILDVAVLPEFQGRGIGRDIMERLHAKAPSERFMLLDVRGAAGFYEGLGYRKEGLGMVRDGE